MHLQSASSPAQLRACLGELESALLPGFLTKEFVRFPRVVIGVFTAEPQADAGAPEGVRWDTACG